MSSNQVEALKKELSRVRSKARILENCLDLDCRVWLLPLSGKLEDYPYPQMPIAFSYRAVGEGNRFIVLGKDVESIEKMAQVFSKERFGENAIESKELDQSRIGFMFEEYGLVWEVVAPSLHESDWLVADSDRRKTRYLSNSELSSKKEFSFAD